LNFTDEYIGFKIGNNGHKKNIYYHSRKTNYSQITIEYLCTEQLWTESNLYNYFHNLQFYMNGTAYSIDGKIKRVWKKKKRFFREKTENLKLIESSLVPTYYIIYAGFNRFRMRADEIGL